MDKCLNKKCIFVTYDVMLKRYLWSNGVDNILYGMNPNSKRLFWVYERNEALTDLLNKWFEFKK